MGCSRLKNLSLETQEKQRHPVAGSKSICCGRKGQKRDIRTPFRVFSAGEDDSPETKDMEEKN